MLKSRRKIVVAVACAIVGLGAAAASPSPLSQLAGRYSHTFKNGDISGDTYNTTDEVKIYPLDRRRAEISLELFFFNGHSCTVYGTATLEGTKLVYRDETQWGDRPACELKIWRDRTKLRWSDGEGTCQSHCGARGGLSNGEISYKSRRPLRNRPESPLN